MRRSHRRRKNPTRTIQRLGFLEERNNDALNRWRQTLKDESGMHRQDDVMWPNMTFTHDDLRKSFDEWREGLPYIEGKVIVAREVEWKLLLLDFRSFLMSERRNFLTLKVKWP